MQDLRLKAEDLRIKTEESLRERSYRHWFTLCQERLRLEPIATQIESHIRQKWLLKVTFAAMSRYNSIRLGKKQMYASILSYHSKTVLERTFRKLSVYGEKRAAHRDMNDDAQLLLRKHAFRRLLRTA